jgi:hypothetical protein
VRERERESGRASDSESVRAIAHIGALHGGDFGAETGRKPRGGLHDVDDRTHVRRQGVRLDADGGAVPRQVHEVRRVQQHLRLETQKQKQMQAQESQS